MFEHKDNFMTLINAHFDCSGKSRQLKVHTVFLFLFFYFIHYFQYFSYYFIYRFALISFR